MTSRKKAMKATSWRIQESSRNPCGMTLGNQSTMPERRSATPPSSAIQNSAFCPPLYFPVSGSVDSKRKYLAKYAGLSHLVSFADIRIWLHQLAAIHKRPTEKSTPMKGWSQRQTANPPNRGAIQPK